jgi:biotin/methionine sulfoxide reductase
MTPSRGQTATHWGNFRVRKLSSGSIEVLSATEDPSPSPIGRSLASTQDPKCRIGRPMVRKSYYEQGIGSDGAMRGREPFVAVEWDDALALAAAALSHAREAGGNQSIYGGSYGWASAGRFHHAQSQIHRFLRGFGGYTDSVNSYSAAAAEVIVPHVIGMDFYRAAVEAPSSQEIARHCKLVVFFGGAAVKNTQVNPGGVGRHNHAEYLDSIANAGVNFVNISPLRDDAAAALRADWWACRPNSDTAIMLGIAHTLIAENLHDNEFLARYCVGFPLFAAYVMGTNDGVPKSAEWAQHLCEIDAQRIRALARRMAGERCLIALSLSVQRAEHGEQTYWAAIALAAMLGHIGLPGGGFMFASGVGKMTLLERKRLTFSVGSLPRGKNTVSSFIPVARVTDMLERPGQTIDYNGRKLIYPDIRLIYWAGGNPFHHHQDINRLRRAWARPETVIINESYWTTTARHADIVFPVATSLERADFAGSSVDNCLTPMQQALPPYGESRSDYAIFSRLAALLGFAETFTEGLDENGWVRRLYEKTAMNAAAVGIPLPDFETFMEGEPLALAPVLPDATYTMEKFRSDPVRYALGTPSGKIEIFSASIAKFGYPDCRGHPAWFDKTEWLGSRLAQEFPLHLLSNQPSTRLHSQLDHGVTSRESKIQGREPLRINPSDARQRGIQDGDIVRVYNSRGSTLAGARLSEALRRGVVQIATGAWYDVADPSDPLSPEIHGNPNAITNDVGASCLSQGPSSNSCLVQVEKFTGVLPDIKVFEPPVMLHPLLAGDRCCVIETQHR